MKPNKNVSKKPSGSATAAHAFSAPSGHRSLAAHAALTDRDSAGTRLLSAEKASTFSAGQVLTFAEKTAGIVGSSSEHSVLATASPTKAGLPIALRSRKLIEIRSEDVDVLMAAGYTFEECQSMLSLGMTPLVLERLTKTGIELSVKESIECLRTCILMGEAEAEKAKDQDLVLVLGNTGAGKSTAVNYLFGCLMDEVKNDKKKKIIIVKKDSPVKEIAAIGHGASKTFIPSVMSSENTGLTFCDCPGFFDGRGTEINISNAVNIRHVIENAKSIKVIILVDYRAIGQNRGQTTGELNKMLSGLFGDVDIAQYASSILIGITQAPLTIDDDPVLLEDILSNLFNGDGFPQVFKKQTFILDPRDRRPAEEACSRRDWIKKIKALKPVKDHNAVCQTVLTHKDKLKLIEVSKEIVKSITQHFQNKAFELARDEIRDMFYLSAVKHSEIDQVFAEVLREVKIYAEEQQQKIETMIRKQEFDVALEHSKSYYQYVRLFAEYLPILKEDYNKIIALFRSSRFESYVTACEEAMKNLAASFDQEPDQVVKTEMTMQLHQILNLEKPSINDEGAHNKIADFLEVMANNSHLAEPSKKAFNALHELVSYVQYLGQKNQFLGVFDVRLNAMQKSGYEQLLRLGRESARIIEEAANKTLLELKDKAVELIRQLQGMIEWEKNGKDFLACFLNCKVDAISPDFPLKSDALFSEKDSVVRLMEAFERLPAVSEVAKQLQQVMKDAIEPSQKSSKLKESHNITLALVNALAPIYNNLSKVYEKEKAQLKKEQEINEVGEFIQRIVAIITEGKFDQLTGEIKQLDRLSNLQKEVMKRDSRPLRLFKSNIPCC